MIRIPCPVCGLRDHSEFTYYRPAGESPDLDAPQQNWVQYLFIRENVKGPVREHWHHLHGCRLWLVVERDTLTHEVSSVEIAHQSAAQALKDSLGKKWRQRQRQKTGGNRQGRQENAKWQTAPMNSLRLDRGGRIDRSRPLRFYWQGRPLQGYAGDTLASAMLANNISLAGRSFKYHRPRGIMSAGVEESGALVTLGRGARLDPNTRPSSTELCDGLQARAQNAWPSLGFDLGAINNSISQFLPAGFYYKTFMGSGRDTRTWMFFEKFIRRAAGMGAASREPDPDQYEIGHAHCDLLVVGSRPRRFGRGPNRSRKGVAGFGGRARFRARRRVPQGCRRNRRHGVAGVARPSTYRHGENRQCRDFVADDGLWPLRRRGRRPRRAHQPRPARRGSTVAARAQLGSPLPQHPAGNRSHRAHVRLCRQRPARSFPGRRHSDLHQSLCRGSGSAGRHFHQQRFGL